MVCRQKKHGFGSEGMVAGMGCQTLAFVGWLFPFFYYLKNWLKPCNFIAGTLVSINFIDLQNGIIQDRVAFRKSNERTHCVGDEVPLSCFDRRYSGSLSGFGSADM